MKNKLTNIKKISDKQLKFSPKQIIFLTLEHIQLAQESLTLIGLKKCLSSLEIYNNWLPLTVQTILTQYLLVGESNLNFFWKIQSYVLIVPILAKQPFCEILPVTMERFGWKPCHLHLLQLILSWATDYDFPLS